jgi:hypothetical protein
LRRLETAALIRQLPKKIDGTASAPPYGFVRSDLRFDCKRTAEPSW